MNKPTNQSIYMSNFSCSWTCDHRQRKFVDDEVRNNLVAVTLIASGHHGYVFHVVNNEIRVRSKNINPANFLVNSFKMTRQTFLFASQFLMRLFVELLHLLVSSPFPYLTLFPPSEMDYVKVLLGLTRLMNSWERSNQTRAYRGVPVNWQWLMALGASPRLTTFYIFSRISWLVLRQRRTSEKT